MLIWVMQSFHKAQTIMLSSVRNFAEEVDFNDDQNGNDDYVKKLFDVEKINATLSCITEFLSNQP